MSRRDCPEGSDGNKGLRRSARNKATHTGVVPGSDKEEHSSESESEINITEDGSVETVDEGDKTSSDSDTETMNSDKMDRENSKDSGRSTIGVQSMTEFMQMFMQDSRRREEENRREERNRREEERIRREDEQARREDERIRREEAERVREDRLITTLRETRLATPTPTHNQHSELPRMREGDDIETYIPIFEAALRSNAIPEAQ